MELAVEVVPRKDGANRKSAHGHVYFEVPTQAEIDNAYLQIETACNIAVVEKYGKWEIAKERLATALDSLKQSNTAFKMLVAKHVADLSKEKNSPMFCAHSVSIIDYLLGISPFDPLPPHYFCPDCQYIETSDNVTDGLDLAYKKCPVCGKEMLRSGHNCNETLAWNIWFGRNSRSYQMSVTIPVLLELQAYLDRGLYHTECTRGIYCNITITSFVYINWIFELQNITGKKISDIPLNDKGIWIKAIQRYLKATNSNLNLPVQIDKFSFNELIQVIGLKYAMYNNKSIEMINNPDYPLFEDDRTTRVFRSSKSGCLGSIIPSYYVEWYKNSFPKVFEDIITDTEN